MSNIITTQNETLNQNDINKDEVEIKSGDYWLKKYDEDNKFSSNNDVRLVSSLNIIDGILHSVVVEPNPKTKWSSSNCHSAETTLTVDDFLRLYEPIDQDKAKAIREADLAQLQEEMNEISKELAIGYRESDDDTGATQKLTAIAEKQKSDMSLPIAMAKEQNIATIKQQTEDIKSIVAKQKEFIEEKTKELSLVSKNLSAIYQEQASKSLASVDGTIKFIAKLEKSIHTLDIFTGKGVNVLVLCEGEEAPKEEKLHFYQRKLFLDEEFWVNIANGGADYNSVDDFKKALKEDISVIDRMIPSQKGVVLMQFRRNPKSWGDENEYKVSIAQALMIAMRKQAEYEANKEQFLLVRNGKNVYMIFSDDIQGGERLFPTEEEVKEIFRKDGRFTGVEVDRYLNFKELENKKARDKMDAKSLYYKRLLVLMYGLHERDKKVFGENLDGDWFSQKFQSQKFQFVYDDEDALDYNSRSLNDFITEKSNALQSGSRVIADWYNVMDEDNAKGMFSNPTYGEPEQTWVPVYTQEPHIVKNDKGRLYVSVKCRHNWDYSKSRHIRCYINKRTDMLVLDLVKSEEIAFYINSRKHRSSYARTAIFLLGARDMLRREEEEAKESVDYLTEHISKTYPSLDKKYISQKLFESIAFWRVAKNGKSLPDLADGKNLKALEEISKIFYEKAINTDKEDMVAFLKENVSNLLVVTTNNKGVYYSYSIVPEEERICIGRYEGDYPFVQRTEWKKLKKSIKKGKASQSLYGFYKKNEDIVVKLKTLDAESYVLGSIDSNFMESQEKLKENIVKSKSFLTDIISGNDIEETLCKMYEDMLHIRKTSKSRYVEEYKISFLESLYLFDYSHYYESISGNKALSNGDKYFVIVTQNTNLNMLIARYGSDELFKRLIEHIQGYYKRSQDEVATLKEIRSSKSNVFKQKTTGESFFGKDVVLEKKRLDFDCCLVNKKRYWNYPIHSIVSADEMKDIDSEDILEEIFKHYSDNAKEQKKAECFIEQII